MCQSGKIDGPPPRPPTRPSRVCGSSAPAQNDFRKMRKAPGRHPSITASPHGWSRSAAPLTRRAQAHCARSSSRELADARSRRAKDMQQQRPRACSASRHLSANADSTVLLLGFRRSYLPSSTLHHRITHFANVLADLPMSCVVHRLSRAISAFLFFWRRHTPIASLCH